MSKNAEKTILITHDYEPDIGSWTRNYRSIEKATRPILAIHKRQNVPGIAYFTGEAAQRFPWAVKAFRDASISGHAGQTPTSTNSWVYIPPRNF